MKGYTYIYRMIIAILLITVLYILPLLGCYIWVQKAYSKGGIWEYTTPDIRDIYITLLPGINMAMVFLMWSESPLQNRCETLREWITKFFGIKK